MHSYGWSFRNRSGKRIGRIKKCGEDKTRKVAKIMQGCGDYRLSLQFQQCGHCGAKLEDRPPILTRNHAFCSEKHKHKYLEKYMQQVPDSPTRDEMSIEEFMKLPDERR